MRKVYYLVRFRIYLLAKKCKLICMSGTAIGAEKVADFLLKLIGVL